MKALALALVMAVLVIGCRDDAAVNTPHILKYKGTYMWRDINIVIDAAKIDSVDFIITDAVTYSMKFYALNPADRVDFCDCEGKIDKNTSQVMSFVPLVITVSNCDKLRIPSGEFTPDYFSHRPDTVYFDKWEVEETTQDSLLSRLIVLEQ